VPDAACPCTTSRRCPHKLGLCSKSHWSVLEYKTGVTFGATDAGRGYKRHHSEQETKRRMYFRHRLVHRLELAPDLSKNVTETALTTTWLQSARTGLFRPSTTT